MRTSIDARANIDLIEENYRRWQQNPESVDSGWSAFFEGFELGNLPQPNGAAVAEIEAREAALQTRVDSLVYAYCSLGHTIARVDPLAETRPQNPLLSLHEFGFNESDLNLHVSSKFFLDNRPMTLREMVAGLERIYADSIGSEFMHIQDPFADVWILNMHELGADRIGINSLEPRDHFAQRHRPIVEEELRRNAEIELGVREPKLAQTQQWICRPLLCQ